MLSGSTWNFTWLTLSYFHSITLSGFTSVSVFYLFFFRATAIEMVTTLAHSLHGRQYLAQQGIMDKVSNMIRGAETDPFSSFYLPGESP